MERIIISLILASLLVVLVSSIPATADGTVLNSKLISVTVYPEMALIKKALTLKLKKGENRVSLSGLTPEIIDDSIQATTFEPEMSILDIKVSETYLSEFHQEEVKRLKERIEEIERSILVKNAEREAIKSFSSTIDKFSPQIKEHPINIPAINAYFELIEGLFKKTGRSIAEIEEELKKLNKEKENLENELESYGSKKEKSKVISILLFSKREGIGTVEISYLVKSARWSPNYDLRANSVTGKYNIEYIAIIFQNSGEDWKNTEVIVSTQKPASFRDIPELRPWYVDKAERRVFHFMKGVQTFGFQEEAWKGEPAPAIKEELTAVNFILPKGIEIPSDGMPHRVVLASKEDEAVFKYTAVPRFSPYAYLKAEFENPFTYPMLSGEMKVYLDNKFVGKILLNRTLHPGEKRDIPLGIDESIKIERKLTKKFTEYKGTFTKETAINYEYLTEITNGKSKEIELELRDNLPVSRNEKIKIEIKEPKDKSMIKEDGSYTLLLKLKPKDTYRERISFTVIFPSEWEITGVQ